MAKEKKSVPVKPSLPPGIKLPAVIDVEAAVLGAMMFEKEAVAKAFEHLTPDSFYDQRHIYIFEAMIKLFEMNEPIDNITVVDELKKQGHLKEAGDYEYVNSLLQNTSSAAYIEYHCKIVVDKQILRQLINNSNEITQTALMGNDEAHDILDYAEKKIFEIAENHMRSTFTKMNKAVKDALTYIDAINNKDLSQFAVPTGFYELDDLLGGFQKADLIILAARPSMGKTAFALSIARNVAVEANMGVAVFSLEMPTQHLVLRLLCSEARVNAHQVRTGKLPSSEAPKLSKHVHKLTKAPVFIDDTPAQSILEIRAKTRRLKADQDIKLVIIDYLQLLHGPAKSESREREIAHISRSLKALAKELSIPIIALSQLNRSVESRNDKRPQLSDLRESGSIEQDADVVMFLHREDYYNRGGNGGGGDEDGGGMPQQMGDHVEGETEIIVAKHRNGPIGTRKLLFVKDYARFDNLETSHREIGGYSTRMIEEHI